MMLNGFPANLLVDDEDDAPPAYYVRLVWRERDGSLIATEHDKPAAECVRFCQNMIEAFGPQLAAIGIYEADR